MFFICDIVNNLNFNIMAGKGKAIAKGVGFLAKKIGRGGSKAKGFVTKGAPSLRQANKEKEAALSAFKEAAKKESAAVRASGTEDGLRVSHKPEMDAAKKAYKAASQKADAAKQVMKRRATRLGIGAAAVGTYAKSNAEKSALNKRIKDLEAAQSKPKVPKQETPAPAPTQTPETKKPENTNTNGGGSSSGGSRRTSGGGSYTPRRLTQDEIERRNNVTTRRVATSSFSKNKENIVKAKESGKTERYRIKQEEKTKRTNARADRAKNRQNQRTLRQSCKEVQE